jgi:hypothetical protein
MFLKKNPSILKFIFFVTILIKTGLAEDAPKEVEAAKEITCHLDLITGLGMQGLEKAVNFKLDMCPNVENSCCKISDQEIIYKNWITDKEGSNLQDRLKYHEKIFTEFLDMLQIVYIRAGTIVAKLKGILVSDCKAISSRILFFNFPTVFPILKQNLKEMHSFLMNSYKGLYCAVCDGDLVEHFDVKTKEVKLSEKFCRDMISNTLHPMIYFHSHFPVLLNLISKFLTSCSNHGDFIEKPIPAEALFNKAVETSKVLEDCKKSRNQSDWFEKCEDVCENFELTRFPKYFEPNLHEFQKYTKFLKDSIEKLEKQDETTDVITDDGSSHSRILSAQRHLDEGVEKKEEQHIHIEEDPEKRFENLDVMVLGVQSVLGELKTNFTDPGIDLFDIGKNALINEEVLAIIKNLDQEGIESGKVIHSNKVDGEDGEEDEDGDGELNASKSGRESAESIPIQFVFRLGFLILYFIC